MELDHLFMLVEPNGPEIGALTDVGIVETYRRDHPGQGTQNVCFAFENFFIECLWVNDPDALRTALVARTRLHERSLWRTAGTNPFGFAWRDNASSSVAVPTWSYRPSYLPRGVGIDVAVDSDDPRQPMMFKSPGGSAPADWPVAKRGGLQRRRGLGKVRTVRLALPRDVTPSATLRLLAMSTILQVEQALGHIPSLVIEVERAGCGEPLVVRWPVHGS